MTSLEAVKRCEKDVQDACGSHASAARSQPYYLDVTHPKANKGEVVLTLSKLLNIPTEAIATIGDMPNDVLMFRKSGLSIAMGNASDEVQKSRDLCLTTANEERGFRERDGKVHSEQVTSSAVSGASVALGNLD